MSKPLYEFSIKSTETVTVTPSGLSGEVYFYDTLSTVNSNPIYYDASDTYALWKTAGNKYVITLVAGVGLALTNYFLEGGAANTLVGAGTFSGTLVLTSRLFTNSWSRAEKQVFDSLVAFTGSTVDVNAFRGRFPSNADGNDKFTNVWKIETGGSAGAYNVERTYGENGNWCNLLVDGEIEGYFSTRIVAMNFASCVLAWLKSNDNMKQTGVVTWCMLGNLPESPKPEIINSQVHWRVAVPIQVLFLTEGTH